MGIDKNLLEDTYIWAWIIDSFKSSYKIDIVMVRVVYSEEYTM